MAFDRRLQKFSFSSPELDALEAAVQRLMVADALKAFDDGKEEDAWLRVARLEARRATSSAILGLDIDLQRSPAGPRLLRKARDAFNEPIEQGFRSSDQLKIVLAVTELLTVQPYADGDKAAKKLKVEMDARLSAIKRVCDSRADEADRATSALIQAVEEGLKQAADAYSHLWRNVFLAVGVGTLAIAAGIFAGPVVGGLIGSALFGLSGAAAVSAGLAFLGGGALAAGGFGMLGGTVVVASAFGVAGAGTAGVFLGEHGEVGAKLAAMRHLTSFHALVSLGWMDHELAEDFIDSMESQSKTYREQAGAGGKEAKQARKVAEVLETAHGWLRERYGEAVGRGKILRQPVSWTPQRADRHPPGDLADEDFAHLVKAMEERREALTTCLRFLQHSHQRYAEVKDEGWFAGIIGQISGASRERLIQGHGFLSEAVEEVIELLQGHQDEAERLAAAIHKAAGQDQAVKEKDEIITRYQALATEIHAEYRRLMAENEGLRQRLSSFEIRMDESLARAMLTAALFRALRGGGPRQIGQGSGAPQPSACAEDGVDPIRRNIYLDLCFALWFGGAEVSRAATKGKAADVGIQPPPLEELRATIETLGPPLGSPLEEVEHLARDRMAEAHPDRFPQASHAWLHMIEKQYERIRLARDLHRRYHQLAGEV